MNERVEEFLNQAAETPADDYDRQVQTVLSHSEPRQEAEGDPFEGEEHPEPDTGDDWEGLRHDDIDNAERLASLHGDSIRYVHKWGQWIVWDGHRWQRDVKGALILELAKDVPRKLYEQTARTLDEKLAAAARRLSTTSRLQAMVTLTRGIDGIHIEHDDLDADPWALCVENGWLDLKTGTFHDPDPTKLMTMQAGAPWEEDAHAPLWEKCLAEWMPDPELRDYFQRLCGASLAGRVRDHMLVIVHGTGGNGKDTAFGAIAGALGDYFTVPHKSLLVAQRHEQHDTVKASLFRVRMAVAAESEKKVKLNEAQIKELTGGGKLKARRMYENEWMFTPSHTMWLQTNYLPEISGTDRGIWRRIRVAPWEATFTGSKDDRDLAEKLEAERAGILRWLVEGVEKWLDVGLGDDTVPQTVRVATDTYRQSQDLIGRWIDDAGYMLGDELVTDSTELIDSWKAWTEAEYGRPRRFNEVTEWLENHDCTRDPHKYTDANGKRKQKTVWQGIGREPTTLLEADEIAP